MTVTLADLAPSLVQRVVLMPQRGEAEPIALWVKRDDQVGSVYGGNKVRKLERLLGAVRAEGRSRVLTIGAAGSHQVVATAIFAARLGLDVEAVLVPQPASARGARNLRVALAHGLRPVPVPAWSLAPLVLAARLRAAPRAAFLPLGGSNVTGSLAFVDAAAELAAQVRAGLAPEPEVVVVAMGSGGTAAGLAAGLERAGLRSRVLAVAISEPAFALGLAARRLAYATARASGLSRASSLRAAARLEIDGGQVGRGYGHPTAAGRVATRDAAHLGLALDDVYTAKAFAAAASRAPSCTVLFWHTLSTRPWPEAEVPALPARLASLFRP